MVFLSLSLSLSTPVYLGHPLASLVVVLLEVVVVAFSPCRSPSPPPPPPWDGGRLLLLGKHTMHHSLPYRGGGGVDGGVGRLLSLSFSLTHSFALSDPGDGCGYAVQQNTNHHSVPTGVVVMVVVFLSLYLFLPLSI